MFNSKPCSRTAFTRRFHNILLLLVLLGLGPASAFPQGTTSGWTPPGIAPGAPTGSYPLSDFENINLYNGHLSGALPLFTIGGRGEAGYTATLNITPVSWVVESQANWFQQCYADDTCQNYWYFSHAVKPDPNEWISNPGYGPGVMYFRRSGGDVSLTPSGYSVYGTTLTRGTFAMPDGTELEFIDQAHEGLVGSYGFNWNDRGRIWTTRDGGESATFISDNEIFDIQYSDEELSSTGGILPLAATGDLYLKNGLLYRIENGYVQWIRDRNGNKVSFEYSGGQLSKAIDALNREITFTYNVNDGYPYGVCDRITYKGFAGTSRNIRISHTSLGNALRPGYSLQNPHQLFPELYGYNSPNFNPTVISALWLPDDGVNFKGYQFRYNSYSELAQVQLPTGGGYQYDYGRGSPGSGGGVVGNYGYQLYSGDTPPDAPRVGIYRRVTQRRIYTDLANNVLESTAVYEMPVVTGSGFEATEAVTVKTYDTYPGGHSINGSRHYFYMDAAFSMLFDDIGDNYTVRPWQDSREFKTEALDAAGNALRRVENAWVPAQLPGGPHITDSITTLLDTNQISKQHFEYDSYNNVTLQEDYDFDVGSPGGLLRRTSTAYLHINSAVNNAVYDNPYPVNLNLPIIHLRSLPEQVSISDASYERARTRYEYDKYSGDANHLSLKDWSATTGLAMSGRDSSFTATYQTRGNATATTGYLLVNGAVNGSANSFAQFDLAGNVVKAIDARGYATSFEFIDHFGSPDAEAQYNSVPVELSPPSSSVLSAYAFASKITNALGQSSHNQFDYYLGKPVDSENLNGVVTSNYYNDTLDRSTQTIRAANQSTAIRTQAAISYDVMGLLTTETKDQATFGDNLIKTQTVYDGLGRMTETRTFESSTDYIAVRQIPFALLQDPDNGQWLTTRQSSNPFRPYLGQTPVWTTSFIDALGRPLKVRTPDNAISRTSYSGNESTITDQNSKTRKSVSDGVGRITKVYEDPANLNYLTTYTYDGLDDLLTITQGTQPTRSFVYDSFKRVTSAFNPENGTNGYQYDANGNLVVKSDARGVSSHAAYDELGRVIRRWYNSSALQTDTTNNIPALPTGVAVSDQVNYWYDGQGVPSGAPSFTRGLSIGRLVAVTVAGSSTGDYYGYDALGQTVLKIQQTGSVNYSVTADYNKSGMVRSSVYPSLHSTATTYDLAGRTSGVSGNLGDGTNRTYSTGITYSPFGGLSQEQFGTDTALYNKLFYNSRGQVAEIRESTQANNTSWNRGAIINHYSEQCWGMCVGYSMPDNNGSLKNQDVYVPNSDGSINATWRDHYDYDPLNRLLRVHEYTGDSQKDWQQEFDIDRWGNRKIHQTNTWGANIPKPDYGVDTTTNRLTGSAGYTMTYDNAGNLTTDTYANNSSVTYDAENRMKSVINGGVTSTYTYDGSGHRVKRKSGYLETWQFYGIAGELLAEYAPTAPPSLPDKEYGYRGGQLLNTTAKVDLALGKTASQSSTFTNAGVTFSAGLAIDGNTDGAFWHVSSATTNYAAENWWQVDLGSSQLIGTIEVWPRTDCCPEHTANFYVLVSDNPFTSTDLNTTLNQSGVSNFWVAGNNATVASVNVNRTGRYVRVQRNDWQYLVLAEVRVLSPTFDVEWLVTDQIGTPRIIFDKTGSLSNTKRHDYLPFGEELNNQGLRPLTQGYAIYDGIRQKFTNQERDNETQLDYFNARYYSSGQGRFTGVDPDNAGGSIPNPQSWNGYAYALNDPLKYTDPTGLNPVICRKGGKIIMCSTLVDQVRKGQFETLTYEDPNTGLTITVRRSDFVKTVNTERADGTLVSTTTFDQTAFLAAGARLMAIAQGRARASAGFTGFGGGGDVSGGGAGGCWDCGPGAMRRLRYVPSDKHGREKRGNISAAPTNGQDALDNSIQAKATSTARVGIDYDTGEFVVFRATNDAHGEFHGYVNTWQELPDEMKTALIKSGMVTPKGKITARN